jgi:hypothetical protein
MASQDIGTLDRWNSEKYQAWLNTTSAERLRLEYRLARSKRNKTFLGLWANAVSALFTVPVTVGVAAVIHIAVHVATQAKYINYCSQCRICEAELKRRGLTS